MFANVCIKRPYVFFTFEPVGLAYASEWHEEYSDAIVYVAM